MLALLSECFAGDALLAPVSPSASTLPASRLAPVGAYGGTFFFEADGARASDVARAVSEFYGVSVLVFGEQGSRTVDGELRCTNVLDAVESLGFLLGARWRELGKGIYLVGGKEEKVVRDFPSYGIDATQLGSSLRDGVSVLGDRVVVETDQVRANQIGKMLESMGCWRALTLEVFLLDVADTKVDLVNAWLKSFSVGAQLMGSSPSPYLGPLASPAFAKRGVSGVADVQGLLELVAMDSGVRVDCRERLQVLSGGKSLFTSGQVLEDVTY